MSQIVSPEQVIDLAPHIIKAGHTLLLEGAPGTAKTSLTRAVAEVVAKTLGLTLTESLAPKKKEYGYIKMHMGNHDPVDFTLPFTYDDNGVTRQGRATMDILPTQGRGLFVFEEVGQNPDVSRIVAQIVSERRLGDVHIPDGWDFMMTTNRAGDRAGSSRLLTHLGNRIIRMTVKPTVEGYLAHNKDTTPEIASTLTWFPDLLDTFLEPDPPYKPVDGPFASTRSIAMLNKQLVTGTPTDDSMRPIVEGVVGPRFAATFFSVVRLQSTLPDIDGLLSRPEDYVEEIKALGTSPDVVCALSIVLSKRVKRDVSVFGKCVALMERVSEERAVSFVRLSIMMNEAVADEPEYGEFISKHQQMFC